MQGDDGNIIDGFAPAEQIKSETDFYQNWSRYAGHKNTVETDQKLLWFNQFHKYIQVTGDRSILNETWWYDSRYEAELAMEF
jgi:hypothetical protein